jgi:hypothetical protein
LKRKEANARKSLWKWRTVEKVNDFLLGDNEIYFLKVLKFCPLVLLIDSVIIVKTLKIWLSSEVVK